MSTQVWVLQQMTQFNGEVTFQVTSKKVWQARVEWMRRSEKKNRIPRYRYEWLAESPDKAMLEAMKNLTEG